MPKVTITSTIESNALLEQIGRVEVIHWIESQGYTCLGAEEQSKYVNIEKSMGTKPFYDLLADSIEQGRLSLEMIVGTVAARKLLRDANQKMGQPK